MVTVQKVDFKDFDQIYPLLKKINTAHSEKDFWENLFVRQWTHQEDFIGFALMADGEPVGFLGCVTSKQLIGGKEEKFCNMTSWIVDEAYTAQSTLLLLSLLKLKDSTLTNFTASERVAKVLANVGFEEIATHFRVFPFCMPFNPLSQKVSLEFNVDQIEAHLDDADQRILNDHRTFQAQHCLLQAGGESCYFICLKKRKKGLTFMEVQYVSDRDIFLKHIRQIAPRLALRFKVWGVLLQEHRLKPESVFLSFRIPRPQPSFFKSDKLSAQDVSTLYSEIFILNH